MPELSPIEKAQFEGELRNHIIACVVDPGCPSPDLARSIMRSIGSRKTHFGGGHIDTIYKNHFGRDASKVYEYIVTNYGYLLDEQGIDYDDQSEQQNEGKTQQDYQEPEPQDPQEPQEPEPQDPQDPQQWQGGSTAGSTAGSQRPAGLLAGFSLTTWALIIAGGISGIYFIKNK